MVIDAPVDHAWTLLTDLERIVPSMPGAILEEISGDDFTGTVSVKVGPIAMKYRGVARFQELDPAARRAVISAQGTDASGQGTVNAVITAQLTPEGARTRVLVDTDLNIEGRACPIRPWWPGRRQRTADDPVRPQPRCNPGPAGG